jgi:thiosulfate/3-mercaptopyruvate sulfurtransferase
MSSPLIEPSALFEIINTPKVIILDCSPTSNKSGLEAYAEGQYIRGTRQFNLSLFSDQTSPYPNTLCSAEQFEVQAQLLGIMKDSNIVIYDNLGVYMSPRVRWMFKTMGHKQVSILNGGIKAWVESGYPKTTELITKYEKGNFKATFQPLGYCNASDLLTHLEDPSYSTLDARSEKRFNGSVAEPRAGMRSGHIPNSKNLPFRTVISDGKFLPKHDLTRIFKEYNIEHESLIFTCGSGITACIIQTAAEICLNNQLSVFDGSWSEWSMRTELPIE